jgi:hypothetical protein
LLPAGGHLGLPIPSDRPRFHHPGQTLVVDFRSGLCDDYRQFVVVRRLLRKRRTGQQHTDCACYFGRQTGTSALAQPSEGLSARLSHLPPRRIGHPRAARQACDSCDKTQRKRAPGQPLSSLRTATARLGVGLSRSGILPLPARVRGAMLTLAVGMLALSLCLVEHACAWHPAPRRQRGKMPRLHGARANRPHSLA